MSIRLALAGNPNCGKTTMFNDLTGATQYVGNWPGVTVEKKEGRWKADKEIRITDLPGIYSLSPYTLEEVVARDYLVGEKPDAIMDLVDASNIERNLYLTTQLLEMGIPVVVALNMMDIVEKRGDVIDVKKLSSLLGVPVVETAAVKGKGTKELVEAAKKAVSAGKLPPQHEFPENIEKALQQITDMIAGVTEESQRRWYAVKLFERDQKVMARFQFSVDTQAKLEAIISAVEEDHYGCALPVYRRHCQGLRQKEKDRHDRVGQDRPYRDQPHPGATDLCAGHVHCVLCIGDHGRHHPDRLGQRRRVRRRLASGRLWRGRV